MELIGYYSGVRTDMKVESIRVMSENELNLSNAKRLGPDESLIRNMQLYMQGVKDHQVQSVNKPNSAMTRVSDAEAGTAASGIREKIYFDLFGLQKTLDRSGMFSDKKILDVKSQISETGTFEGAVFAMQAAGTMQFLTTSMSSSTASNVEERIRSLTRRS